MRRASFVSVVCLCLALFLGSCSVRRNNASTRFYHNLTTRYNVYFHGKNAFDETYNSFVASYSESYSRQISLDPIEAQRGALKEQKGGAFDSALAKGQTAIKLHSIRTKPERKGRPSAREAEFYKRREYNTFLHNAWLLVGKSQFYNGDFLDAMATFSYMSRLYATEPAIRDEARLWQARSYTAMGWLHEAEEMIRTLQTDASYLRKSQVYDKTLAEVALSKERIDEAIEPLRRAIAKEESRTEKLRMRYLLGQLLVRSGRPGEAQKVFRSLLSKAPPFALEFATQLRLVEIEAERNVRRAITTTEKMARRGRNKEVLDRLYLTQGDLYLRQLDSLSALKSYNLGVEKSTEHGGDFALCAVAAGQIYLAKRDWDEAQKSFATGVAALPKSHPKSEEYTTLSKQLDALALHVRAVAEQDSLRHLASLPEVEKFRIIDSAIAAYEKAQRERERDERMAARQEEQDAINEQLGSNTPSGVSKTPDQGMPTSGEFYFYNPQLIARGKAQFKQKWGNRTLEDNWRRRQKSVMPSASSPAFESQPTPEQADSLASDTTASPSGAPQDLPPGQDPTKREYYLAQLPTTPEELAASDVIIQNGLLGMAQVFQEEMELFDEATYALEELLRRYPNYEERLGVYYQLYMLLERRGLTSEAQAWRRKMLAEFAEEPLAKAVASPQYLEQLRTAQEQEERLYNEAFAAYLSGNPMAVRTSATELHTEYPLSPLMPKMDFLKALSYVLEGEEIAFKQALEQLLKEYQRDEVLELAQQMLRELTGGRSISKGGYSGLNYELSFAGDGESMPDSLYTYRLPLLRSPHSVVLLCAEVNVEYHSLLFALTSFNFSRYTDLPLEVSLERLSPIQRVTISGFSSERDAWNYVRDAYSPEGYMPALPGDALLFAMDQASYKALLSGASLGNYFDFLADSIAPRQAAVALALSRYEEIAKAREEAAVAPAKAIETPQETVPVETEKAPEPKPEPREEETPIYQVNETAPISYEDVEQAARERKQREREEAKAKKKREEEVKRQREEERRAKEAERKQRAEELKKKQEEERRAKEAERKQRAEELKKKREEERRAKEVERKQQTTERKSVER